MESLGLTKAASTRTEAANVPAYPSPKVTIYSIRSTVPGFEPPLEQARYESAGSLPCAWYRSRYFKCTRYPHVVGDGACVVNEVAAWAYERQRRPQPQRFTRTYIHNYIPARPRTSQDTRIWNHYLLLIIKTEIPDLIVETKARRRRRAGERKEPRIQLLTSSPIPSSLCMHGHE